MENVSTFLYLQRRNLQHAYFQIQFINVSTKNDNSPHLLTNVQRSKRSKRRQQQRLKNQPPKIKVQNESSQISQTGKRKRNCDTVSKSCGGKDRMDNVEGDFAEKALEFKYKTQDEPYYICRVCNRCLYKRSAIQFDEKKHEFNEPGLFNNITSFNGQLYFCKTCHKKVKSNNSPC